MKDGTPPKCPLCNRSTSKLAEQPLPRAPDDGSEKSLIASIVRVAFFRYRCLSCHSVWYDHLDGNPLTRRSETKH